MPSGTGQHVAERKNKTAYEAYDSAVLALQVGSLLLALLRRLLLLLLILQRNISHNNTNEYQHNHHEPHHRRRQKLPANCTTATAAPQPAAATKTNFAKGLWKHFFCRSMSHTLLNYHPGNPYLRHCLQCPYDSIQIPTSCLPPSHETASVRRHLQHLTKAANPDLL